MLARSILLTRVWRVRLAACLSTLWIVLGASLANAATLVPMCGEHADTVVAPPIERPGVDTTIRPGACGERGAWVLGSGSLPEKTPERSSAPESAPRFPPFSFRLPPVPCTRALLEDTCSGERPGYPAGVERPPR